MAYTVEFSKEAVADVERLKRNNPELLKKLAKLIVEVGSHPRSGIGQCERLKGVEAETWSRRINQRHRLVYEIYDERIVVLIVSAYGHYE